MRTPAYLALAVCLFASSLRAATPDLARDVLPVLKAHCVRCHGPAKVEAGLNLALATGIRRGGDNGAAIAAGDVDASLLWERVSKDEMPPEEPLSAEDKETLRLWIAGGAPGLPAEVAAEPDGEEHYAFQHLHPTPPPAVADESRVRNDIDRYVLAKLTAAGMSMNPEADRSTLIRRVCFDLTGLPPTPEEIDAFVNDADPQAYERMVERYLESPRYGERWGKYWLDAAGYADSNGYFNADTDRPLAYRYRDYVIRSINADMPWDQFIREQLAGDELAGYGPGMDIRPEMVDRLDASHFLRNSPDGTGVSDGNPDEVLNDKYSVLEGELQIFGSCLFGITVQCAKCHDHKFEPFKQSDYYQLQAVLAPSFNVQQWKKPSERDISIETAAEAAERAAANKVIDEEVAALKSAHNEWAKANRERGQVVFEDEFDGNAPLAERWANAAPGDEWPAGQPPIQVDSPESPGAQVVDGTLRIQESGGTGDRALCTKQVFDWTPNSDGAWVQVTFDLVAGGPTAPYVGYLLALKDFNDRTPASGGNILFDGNAAGKASVYVDYPGADSANKGQVGNSGYTPGRNYGVRITRKAEDKFELAQVIDGTAEAGTVELTDKDLPDGGFGFEFCCGRSFAVDNVLVEVSELTADDPAVVALAAEHKRRREELDAAVKAVEAKRPAAPPQLAIVTDMATEIPVVHLLERGSFKTPGAEMAPAAPAFLAEDSNPAAMVLPAERKLPTSGRRLALAQWITRPDSRAAAVLARVTVNRWWQHHFGNGIVSTSENLGYSGATPTHPELLEYLADQLIKNGWSAKAMHRLIVNSTTYRQSSAPRADAEESDPQNSLLWRYPLRRLDAEALRDAMLAVSGELDATMYGSYTPTSRDGTGEVVVDEKASGAHRRSLYMYQRRTQVLGMLESFDAPSIVFSCTARPSTTVPLQSLKLLNSDFVRARATGLARRVPRSQPEHDAEVIRQVYLITTGRAPTDAERDISLAFLATQPQQYPGADDANERAWIDYCHMLLAGNAFLYVE